MKFNGKSVCMVLNVGGENVSDTVASMSITEDADGTVTMVNTLESGETETITIEPDANGNPAKMTYNGKEIPIEWVVNA